MRRHVQLNMHTGYGEIFLSYYSIQMNSGVDLYSAKYMKMVP